MSNWMGVVHAAHVQEAVELGIAQLNQLRRGVVVLDDHDAGLIRAAMTS